MMLHILSTARWCYTLCLFYKRDFDTPKHQTEFNVRNFCFLKQKIPKNFSVFFCNGTSYFNEWPTSLIWACFPSKPSCYHTFHSLQEIISEINFISQLRNFHLEAAYLAQKLRWVHLFAEITGVFRNLRFYGDKTERLKKFPENIQKFLWLICYRNYSNILVLHPWFSFLNCFRLFNLLYNILRSTVQNKRHAINIFFKDSPQVSSWFMLYMLSSIERELKPWSDTKNEAPGT